MFMTLIYQWALLAVAMSGKNYELINMTTGERDVLWLGFSLLILLLLQDG